jgi:hypothetical protein
VQRVVLATEVFVHVRRALEFAVKGVGPAMIRTLDAAREPAMVFAADAGSAMAANVVEGLDCSRGVAGDDDAFTSQFSEKEIAWVGNLLGAASADPGLEEEGFEFVAKDLGISVVAGRKRHRLRGHGKYRVAD